MCGIAGFCDFTKDSSQEVLLQMTNTLSHRGPDDAGYKIWDNEFASIGFGHRRLSIIDLSTGGHQPMVSPCNRYSIVFNGEIYNFKSIRKELINLGFSFSSGSDTEVILNAFIQWGVESVHKFIGMFAYVIYDQEEKQIWVVRDRAGVKPLFYYFDQGLFLFGSELKAFHPHHRFKKELDLKSVGEFLKFGYVPTPHSIFKNTFKLKPGYYLKLNLGNKSLKEVKYWDIQNDKVATIQAGPIESHLDEMETLLKSACSYRMVADVPVGVFLSGGYDSTLITALIQSEQTQKIKTFCIGFKEAEFNESGYAYQVAAHLGTDHTDYICSPKDLLDLIPQLPEIYDEPFGDSSAIPTILVSKLAKERVKVVLSADAGDEVFAGYDKYKTFINIFQKYNGLPPVAKKVILNVIRLGLGKAIRPFGIYNIETRINKTESLLQTQEIHKYFRILSQFFSDQEIESLVNLGLSEDRKGYFDDIPNDSDLLNQILAIDYKTFLLDDILTKVDRATMSVSIEGREPLLDHRIVEYMAQLPGAFKIYNQTQKYFIKQITHKYVPAKIMDRPKMGFSIPLKQWLLNDLRDLVLYYLSPSYIKEQGIFNPSKMDLLRRQYEIGLNINPQKLWFVLMFQMWYDKWMK